MCAGGRWPASLMVLLVAPRVFQAPEGPAAVCAGGRRPARVMVLLVAPRVFRAPEGPAAREARASLRSAPRLEARPCPPVPPAPSTPVGPGRGCVPQLCASKPGQGPPPPMGTAAVPSGPSGALHTGGAWSLMCYWVRCFEARPGPAPRRVPYPQFRMQFPDTCSSSLSEKPGISTITFQSMKCAWENCMRICADQAPPPPTGTAAWPAASWGRHGGLAC